MRKDLFPARLDWQRLTEAMHDVALYSYEVTSKDGSHFNCWDVKMHFGTWKTTPEESDIRTIRTFYNVADAWHIYRFLAGGSETEYKMLAKDWAYTFEDLEGKA